jgi:hypothetical protein
MHLYQVKVPLWCLSLICLMSLSHNELALCHGSMATVPVAWLQVTADLMSPHGGNPMGHALMLCLLLNHLIGTKGSNDLKTGLLVHLIHSITCLISTTIPISFFYNSVALLTCVLLA